LVQNLPLATSGWLKALAVAAPTSMPWVAFYLVSGLMFAVLLIIIGLVKFPKIELNADEKVEGLAIVLELFKSKIVWAYFIGIFAYVGTEQGVVVWISKFLETYYQANPDTVGAHVSALFWAGQALGCLLGLILIKLMDQRILLASFVVGGMVILSLALFGDYQIA
jgi:fucose permease